MEKLKSFLKSALVIDNLIKANINEIEKINKLYKYVNKNINPNTSFSRGTSYVIKCSDNKTTNLELKLINYEKNLNVQIDKLIDRKQEIKNLIDKIKNKEMHAILILKYLSFKTFSEITEILNYSERQIYRIHNNALKELLIIKNSENISLAE